MTPGMLVTRAMTQSRAVFGQLSSAERIVRHFSAAVSADRCGGTLPGVTVT
jgi:hypothetical protein